MNLETIEHANQEIHVPRFAQIDGLRIAYREGGDGERVVILIHGLCSASFTWEDAFELLAAQHRVIALDLKGYGASDKPIGDYSLDAQADIVVRFMNELGIDCATLVGNSMGGAVALRVVERSGERVSRLVLVDPAVYSAHTRSRLARALLGRSGMIGSTMTFHLLRMLARSPSFIESRMREAYGSPNAIKPSRVAAYHALLNDPACVRAVVATLQAWDLGPVERDLHFITQPTLILWGERDRIIAPHFAQQLAQDLPQAALKILPCGHAPQEEMPVEFAQLVQSFLDETENQNLGAKENFSPASGP